VRIKTGRGVLGKGEDHVTQRKIQSEIGALKKLPNTENAKKDLFLHRDEGSNRGEENLAG